MKKYLLTALFFVAVALTPLGSQADEYDDAVAQLNRGEFKTAIALLEPLVAEHYAPAEYQLALIYKNGYGVAKDIQKTVQLLSKAAAQRLPDAEFDLAVLYSEGNGVEKDLNKAFQLTEMAAKKELPSAQFNLGVMYYNGDGVGKDYLHAARWYQRAADQNYALAQYNLALMYSDGKGVEKSTELSYIWNIIAARNGSTNAATSRDIDERALSMEDIIKAREKADVIYRKIMMQEELKAKLANKKLF